MQVSWKVLSSDEITLKQMYDILALRNAVFIVEQACAYQDIDGLDLHANTLHIVGYTEDQHKIIAYARILDMSKHAEKIIIGRVIVDSSMRGMKLGNRLLAFILAHIHKAELNKPIFLSAQAHLQNFYGSYGFTQVSDIYLEDNIPHIDMLLNS